MTVNRLLAATLLLIAACSSCVLAARPKARPRVIHVEARRYSFLPSTIEVTEGEDVLLEIKSVDRLHGFSVPALGIERDLPPHTLVRIAVRADTPGDFPFHCHIFCGDGHESMGGHLVVLAKSSRPAE